MYNEDRKQRFYEFKLKTVASVTPLVPRFKMCIRDRDIREEVAEIFGWDYNEEDD